MRSTPDREKKKAGIEAFVLWRQAGSPSFFFRGTAPPWERKARPVVMELEETKMDSVTQPNHQGLVPRCTERPKAIPHTAGSRPRDYAIPSCSPNGTLREPEGLETGALRGLVRFPRPS